jgi:RNA polymerase sigma factor (sigma-70 family)
MRTREDVLDDVLVLAAQAGQAEAFERLAARWQPRLARYAWQLLGDADGARDAVQETWLAVVRGLPRLQDPACFRSWVLRITARRCADWIESRRRGRRRTEGLARAESLPSRPETGLDDLLRVRTALAALEPGRRALMSLFYVEGLSVAEIARVLGVPAGTVKSRLHHARERVRAALEVCRDREQ